MKIFNTILALLLSSGLCAQGIWDEGGPAKFRYQELAKNKISLKTTKENSLVSGVPFRNIGPSIMSGRVVDLEVDPTNPAHFFSAYATGGLWETYDNGISFKPLFQNEDVMFIGDIAVDWKFSKGQTIWIGTGECNSSRSSYAGNGIYCSTDGGKTWTHKGLTGTDHIGRVVISQDDPNTVFVAAIGPLFTLDPQGGVFKTTDGGKTWTTALKGEGYMGFIDLIQDPKDANTLYASAWERTRRAWNFTESGTGSGIYKSRDKGVTWAKVTTGDNGFPQDANVGRIGLTMHPSGVLFAVMDNQTPKPKEKDASNKLTKDDLRTISKADFLKLDKEKIASFLKSNGFPEEETAEVVIDKVKTDKLQPSAIVEYLEDANTLLTNASVVGAEVYRSDDGGKTWKKANADYLDEVFSTYGYYFAQIRVSPSDVNDIYVMGVYIVHSTDGGKTFKSASKDNVHADHHALWINPNNSKHLVNGNDGGINISYDAGEHWTKCNSIPVGQIYALQVDMESPYNIYAGFQDNGVWTGSSQTQENEAWLQDGVNPYKFIMGGDGMQIQVDTRDNRTVYTGYQFGNYYRLDKHNGGDSYIHPQHRLGERPPRYNWQTPILLSTFNQDILYMGANRLFRSMNKGESFTAISPDLTRGGLKGDVPYGTITTIDESHLRFGLLYVGTDDGRIWHSPDGGYRWTECIYTHFNTQFKSPDDYDEAQPPYVTRLQASMYDTATVYATLTYYRWDNSLPKVLVSHNYGKDWTELGLNLPLASVNVIREDPSNENILYIGTDQGVYVSFDKGVNFMLFGGGLPTVPVHDIIIHPRDKELVVGTHGRSVWIASVKEIQQLKADSLKSKVQIFPIEDTKFSDHWGKAWGKWEAVDTPAVQIAYYIPNAQDLQLHIVSEKGTLLKTIPLKAVAGLNYTSYDLSLTEANRANFEAELNAKLKKEEPRIKLEAAKNGKLYLPAGKYNVVLQFAPHKVVKQSLVIKAKEKKEAEEPEEREID